MSKEPRVCECSYTTTTSRRVRRRTVRVKRRTASSIELTLPRCDPPRSEAASQRTSINPQNTAPLTPAQGQRVLATAADPKGPFTATTVNGDSNSKNDPGADRRYAGSEDLGCALPRHSPRPARPAASPPIPCAAARSCLCPPCCERPARGSLRPRRERHESGAHLRIAGRGMAQRAAANRLHAYCAPATPDASPRHAPHSLCSLQDARREALHGRLQ